VRAALLPFVEMASRSLRSSSVSVTRYLGAIIVFHGFGTIITRHVTNTKYYVLHCTRLLILSSLVLMLMAPARFAAMINTTGMASQTNFNVTVVEILRKHSMP